MSVTIKSDGKTYKHEGWEQVLLVFALAPKGEIVTTEMIEAYIDDYYKDKIGPYLGALTRRGFIERVKRGQYILTDLGLDCFGDEDD